MSATEPRPEQVKKFLENMPAGRIQMLNLLKFRDRAAYADGRETTLSGGAAYGLYAAAAGKLISEIGGRIEISMETNVLLIGDGDLEWDAVAVVRYPSIESFTRLRKSPAYQAIHVHREAGLEDQILINCLDPNDGQLFRS